MSKKNDLKTGRPDTRATRSNACTFIHSIVTTWPARKNFFVNIFGTFDHAWAAPRICLYEEHGNI
jgi:hypothetical protein